MYARDLQLQPRAANMRLLYERSYRNLTDLSIDSVNPTLSCTRMSHLNGGDAFLLTWHYVTSPFVLLREQALIEHEAEGGVVARSERYQENCRVLLVILFRSLTDNPMHTLFSCCCVLQRRLISVQLS